MFLNLTSKDIKYRLAFGFTLEKAEEEK